MGLSMEDVGKAVGVHKSTIQRYETDIFQGIKLPVLKSLAKALDISVEWLNGSAPVEETRNPELDKMDFDIKVKAADYLIMSRRGILEEEDEKLFLQLFLDFMDSLSIISNRSMDVQEELYAGAGTEETDEAEGTRIRRRRRFKDELAAPVSIISEWIYNLPALLAERKSLSDYLEGACRDKEFMKLYAQAQKKKN